MPGSVAAPLARLEAAEGPRPIIVEHPTGSFQVDMETEGEGADFRVLKSALLRTARPLMRGEVMVPSHVWSGQ